ncbi:MAG TPA: hypothetical protein VGG75_33745 [Trebonia sp.]
MNMFPDASTPSRSPRTGRVIRSAAERSPPSAHACPESGILGAAAAIALAGFNAVRHRAREFSAPCG